MIQSEIRYDVFTEHPIIFLSPIRDVKGTEQVYFTCVSVFGSAICATEQRADTDKKINPALKMLAGENTNESRLSGGLENSKKVIANALE